MTPFSISGQKKEDKDPRQGKKKWGRFLTDGKRCKFETVGKKEWWAVRFFCKAPS